MSSSRQAKGTLLTINLLDWFSLSGRHDLPWQENPTPYRVWVSEIMLQQTQVQTVIPYYLRFMQRFPDIATLADASVDDVLTAWAGLGYYTRGRNLSAAAKKIAAEHSGQFPQKFEQILALPGIGRSTAGAIMALAYNAPYPILDGNVKRVLTRYHLIEEWPGQAAIEADLWEKATSHTPLTRAAEYTQAIMDLGATVCLRQKPKCEICPLVENCAAYRAQRQAFAPGKKPKKPRPERTRLFLLLRRRADNAPLLIRRPNKGIWGGLWSLPDCSEEEYAQQAKFVLTDQIVIDKKDLQRVAQFRHLFSHFALNAVVYAAWWDSACSVANEAEFLADDTRFCWYDLTTPRAIPPPIATIIKESQSDGQRDFLSET